MKKYGYVYLISDSEHRRVYTGVTADVYTRIWKHKCGIARFLGRKIPGNKLVYFEQYALVLDALKRQQLIKKMRRKQKTCLINAINPSRDDLAEGRY